MGNQGPVVMGEGTPLVMGGVTVANVATRLYDASLVDKARDPVAGLDIRPRQIWADELHLKNFLKVGAGVTVQDGAITADMLTVENLQLISSDLGTVDAGTIVCGAGKIIITTSSTGTGARTELYGSGLTVYDSNGDAKTIVDIYGLSIRNDSGASPEVQERLSLADAGGDEYGQLFYDNASLAVNLVALDSLGLSNIDLHLEASGALVMAPASMIVTLAPAGDASFSADTVGFSNTDTTLACAFTINGNLVVADTSGATAGGITCVDVTATATGSIPALTAATSVTTPLVTNSTDLTFTAGASSGDQFIFKRTSTTILSTDDNSDFNFVNDIAAVDGRFSGDLSAANFDNTAAGTTWTPSWSCSGSMTISSVTGVTATHWHFGKWVFFQVYATFTLGGTASTDVRFTLPHNHSQDSMPMGAAQVYDSGFNGLGWPYAVSTDATICGVRKHDAANWATGTGRVLRVTGMYVPA